jgi:hypothetical protein
MDELSSPILNSPQQSRLDQLSNLRPHPDSALEMGYAFVVNEGIPQIIDFQTLDRPEVTEQYDFELAVLDIAIAHGIVIKEQQSVLIILTQPYGHSKSSHCQALPDGVETLVILLDSYPCAFVENVLDLYVVDHDNSIRENPSSFACETSLGISIRVKV